MATRRFKSVTMKFGVPLSVPRSCHVEWCYGMRGNSFCGSPEPGSAIDLLLVNPGRLLWVVPGQDPNRHSHQTDAAERESGWRTSDGSMPLGLHDAIDPELAQLDYLPLPTGCVSFVARTDIEEGESDSAVGSANERVGR